MPTKLFSSAIVALTAIAMQSANAVVIISAESDVAPAGGAVHAPFQPTFTGGSPSSIDLLEGTLPTASAGNFTQELSPGPVALTDGSDATVYPEDGPGGDDIDHAAYATGGNTGGTSLTYSLGGLFDLSSIVVYGGWNDGGRDAQKYEILTSNDGGTTFNSLAIHDGGDGLSGTEPIGWRVAFTEDTLPNLAEDVSHLRFDFNIAVENGYTGYSEIDVLGVQVNVPGDANGDGFVTIADFVMISDNFLTVPSAVGADGDIDANNFVDAADFRMWKDIAPAAVVAQLEGLQVPEPATVGLLVMAILFGCQLRRRR